MSPNISTDTLTIAEAVVVAVQRLYLVDEDDAATGTLNVADVLARAGRT